MGRDDASQVDRDAGAHRSLVGRLATRLARIAMLVAGFYLLYLGTLFALQRSMVFPGQERTSRAWTARRGIERWTRDVDGAEAEALYAPLPEAIRTRKPAPLLVFVHGNGELVDDDLGVIPYYHRLGFNVLLPEYRGYGRSTGSPSQAAIVDDAAYFLDRALARDEVDASRVVYHGCSLGGGVVGALTARREPQALILQSTFTSLRDMASGFYAPGFLVRDPFDTRSVVSRLDIPVLVMFGDRDGVVPPDMGRQLAHTASNARVVHFPHGGHMLPPTAALQRYWSAIADFLSTARVRKPTTR